MTKELPLCFIARKHDEEMDRLEEVIRQRQSMNERIGIIVAKNDQVHGYEKAMKQRGIDIEKAVPPRRPGAAADYDFGNKVPKIATYHSAKGLTFDSVLLPKLTTNSFDRFDHNGLRERILFVGIARATQWVYLSTTKGMEIKEFFLLEEAAAKKHLTI